MIVHGRARWPLLRARRMVPVGLAPPFPLPLALLLIALSLAASGCSGSLGGDASQGASADAREAADAGGGAATTGDTAQRPDVRPDVPTDVRPDVPPDAPTDTQPDVLEDALANAGPPPERGLGSISPLPDPCNDFVACTIDTCEDGACVHTLDPECCTDDAPCGDAIACTTDTCNLALHRCLSARDSGFCCVDTADCDDDDPCAAEVCVARQCVFPPIPGCGPLTLCAA